MRDLHKVYVDDEAYNLSHGQAYEFYGVDRDHGAMVIVRPDQHISKISSAEDLESIGAFFKGFALPRKSKNSLVSSPRL